MYSGTDRNEEIVTAALADNRFSFKERAGYLRGNCPDCGKPEFFIRVSKPGVFKCGRENRCGVTYTAKELFPQLFEQYEKRHPPTPDNPKATADAYLKENRGFQMVVCREFYSQETYRIPNTNDAVSTIRFYLDNEKTRFWERLIGKTKADGQKANIGGKKKQDGSLFRGDVWQPPKQQLKENEECWITEGIFHAIALLHTEKKVAAAISSSNCPLNFIEEHKGKKIKWVLALDADRAGKSYMKKHREKIEKLGENVVIALLPGGGKDWDDYWKEGRLTKEKREKFFDDCLYRGRLFVAGSVKEKAFVTYCQFPNLDNYVLEFGKALYKISLDIGLATALTTAEWDIKSEKRDDTAGLKVFVDNCDTHLISNISPTFLYIEKDDVLNERRYVLNIDYKSGSPSEIIAVEGTALSGWDAFHKMLLKQTNGGRFCGDNFIFNKIVNRWFDQKMKVVKCLNFFGYDAKSKAYIFTDQAWQNGRKIKLNEHGYFDLDKLGVKSVLGGVEMNTDGKFNPAWFPKFLQTFHYQGFATLAFFLGSLFVQQIRQKQKGFTFLELTGDPGTGKSTVLEFCWKLCGRDDEEGFDALKSSVAGRRRALSQFSNLPSVIIESDRDDGKQGGNNKQFGFDDFKPFWNGRSTGTIGVATKGNETRDEPFLGSILISQNATVEASPAILERIVHCHMDKKHHTPNTKELARWFETLTAQDLSGFLGVALKNEKKILQRYFEFYARMDARFTKLDGVKTHRIAMGHAQLAACAYALQIVIPTITNQHLEDFTLYLETRAKSREERITADHPVVEKFWEMYDYINGLREDNHTLNLSKAKGEICVNFNHIMEIAAQYNQERIDLKELKKYMPSSKRHKFIKKNVAGWDKGRQKSMKGWLFKANSGGKK